MKSSIRKSRRGDSTEPAGGYRSGTLQRQPAFVDNRAATVAQRKLTEAIARSGRSVAQRELAAVVSGSPRSVAQRALFDRVGQSSRMAAGRVEERPNGGFPVAGAHEQPLGLRAEYAQAFSALQRVRPALPGGKVVQRILTGDYAKAGLIVIAYARDSYEGTWQARLQEAQDAGFRAPKLTGHASKKPGADDKGEQDRQRQNNERLTDWWAAYQAWKNKKGKKDEDDDDASSGAVTTSSGKRSESKREERKKTSADKKKKAWEEKNKKEYKSPWLT
jgi:hypothetical protein